MHYNLTVKLNECQTTEDGEHYFFKNRKILNSVYIARVFKLLLHLQNLKLEITNYLSCI